MKKKFSALDTEKPVREDAYTLYDQGEYRFDIVVKGDGDQKTAELRVIKKNKRKLQ